MEEILIAEQVERYLNGLMGDVELMNFEHARKTDSVFNELVINHIHFLNHCIIK